MPPETALKAAPYTGPDTGPGTAPATAVATASGPTQTEAALRLHLERSRAAEARLQAEAAARQDDLARIAARLRQTDARATALAAEIAALRRSTSWRITAPLRALIRAARGLR